MNIQIVNSETGDVVFTKQGLKLEVEIPDHSTLPRRSLVARHRRKVLLEDLEAILVGLRAETRKV